MTQLLQSPARTVVVLEGRLRFHLDDCRTVVGRSTSVLLQAEAEQSGMSACGICKPGALAPADLVRRLRGARRARREGQTVLVRRALPLGHVTVPVQVARG